MEQNTEGKQTTSTKRQRIPKEQSQMDNPETLATQDTQDPGRRQRTSNKSQSIPKGQSEILNLETLAKWSHKTQDEDK